MTKDAVGQLEYAKEVSAPSDATPPAGEMPALLTAEQVEDCLPDSGLNTCKHPCGSITVSAQFLHDFAANVQRQYAAQQAVANGVPAEYFINVSGNCEETHYQQVAKEFRANADVVPLYAHPAKDAR